MVDIHTHILPAIDDGAKDMTTAKEMCRMAFGDGIRHIVCTPHANGTYAYERKILEERLAELREKAPPGLELTLGCDFNFSFENIQAAIAEPGRFVIGQTKYLLVELSDFAIPPAIGQALGRFVESGITPVITHPERNLVIQQRPDLVLSFAKRGCVIQLTGNSLTGFWGMAAQRTADWILERQAAHVISSDAHDLTSRPPILSRARDLVSSRYGSDVALALVAANPGAIVSGQPLPYRPEVII
jgi:protein-tyrosine phosphatase